MIQPNFEEFIQKITEIVPDNFAAAPEQVKAQVKSTLQNALAEMDFVTREEFETQKAVLQKTRALVEALEKKVDALEKR